MSADMARQILWAKEETCGRRFKASESLERHLKAFKGFIRAVTAAEKLRQSYGAKEEPC